MIDYLKGLIFVIVFISFLSALGKKLYKRELFSENLIYGFIIYTCIQFVGGFLAQQLRLPWIYYKVYMILTLLFLSIFILYKNTIKLDKKKIIIHFKHYGILYLIAIVFVVLACMNIQYQWNSNLVDDGYYLNKIRMAPFVENYVDYNYATGFSSPGSIIRNVNTFEIEAAFYVDILGMDASIFSKVFLSLTNYILVLNVVYWLYRTVLGDNSKIKYAIVAIVPVLFFGIYQELLVNFGILYMQDSWQFNTAMWYGSTLVRCVGIMILVLPLLNTEKIGVKEIFFFIFSGVALMSKASQALPVLVIVIMIYSIKYIASILKIKKGFKASMLFVIMILLVLICIPISASVDQNSIILYESFSKNMNTLVVKISIFLLAVSYLFEIKKLNKWNTWLLLFGFFMIVPRINTVFIASSFYDFVVGRTVTLYFFTLIISAILNVFIILQKLLITKKSIYASYAFIGVVLIGIPFVSIQRNLGIVNSIGIILNNPKLQPESTLELGNALDKIATEKKEVLNVLMPMWIVNDGTPHPTASMVRYNSTHIKSVSTYPRYNAAYPDNEFANFSQDDQDVLEFYHSGEEQDDEKLEKLLNEYPVNCIVVFYDGTAKRIVEVFGYENVGEVILSDNVHKYTILYKGK